jgi:hypothetical protein
VSQFDYPGTGNQTRPQKINSTGDVVGVYVDTSGVSRGFTMFSNGTFSPPIVDPNDTSNFTEGRGINDRRLVCGDYLDSAGAFEGFFFSRNIYTNYDPEPAFTIVLGVNNAGDFSGSVIPSSTGIQSAFLSIGGVMTDFVIPRAAATLLIRLIRRTRAAVITTTLAGRVMGSTAIAMALFTRGLIRWARRPRSCSAITTEFHGGPLCRRRGRDARHSFHTAEAFGGL